MSRFHAMQVFVKVAETSGFAEAARQLNMSPPAVTRAVASLEDQIGARLFTRTTRTVKLTEAGTRYFDDCRRILADVAEAEAAAGGSYATPTGVLTVTASALFGQDYIAPILTEYLDQNPDVNVRALFVDRITNMVDEGIDVGIRIGELADSSFSAIRVGAVRRVVCGAPAYFEKHGVPLHPSELTRHNIIVSTTSWASLDWRFGGPQKPVVRIAPRLSFNTYGAVLKATMLGWGLARPLSYQIGQALIDGDLQTVLSEFEDEPLPVHVVHPEGRRASAKVRAFVDLAVDRLRANRSIN
ncbi:LysR family transcriptional regulator [Erythrobacter sp. BLCC-B19]|uniref:LysR family transcriptional regulator n=1 Tax=Erythrobacter sp. BLCC-B19 TaxID=3025315 RepID=UPI00235EAA0F|nr:LysR family transcriptional regulator [Erythrobacter sp. BLCC-B19]WDA41000.1 LysR family transcriptional regulator [Erythrobacter sp. BLCC-B19]